MGSFIYNGFISNLPIECGDDCVMLLSKIKYGSYKQHERCYINVDAEGILPCVLPIYGKANDYGCIDKDKVEETPSYDWLRQMLGCEPFDLIGKCYGCMGTPVAEIQNELEKEPDYGTEEKQAYIELFNKLFMRLSASQPSDEAIVCLLERRDVFDLFVEIDKTKPFYYGFHDEHEAKHLREHLIEAIKIIDEYNTFSPLKKSPFSLDIDECIRHEKSFMRVLADKYSDDDKKIREAFFEHAENNKLALEFSHVALLSDIRFDMLCAYNWNQKKLTFNWMDGLDEIENFLHFHRTLVEIFGTYRRCNYGGQGSNYAKVIAIHSAFAKFMRQAKKKHSEYD